MMEASLAAVTPTPMPQQDTSAPTPQTTDDASPFTQILSTAITASKTPQKEKKELDAEAASASGPSQQEMSMAAALAALSFQEIPAITTDQPAPGQDRTSTLTGITNGSSPTVLTPGELKQLQTILAANGQTLAGLTPGTLKQLQTILAANKQNASEVPPGILKQFQEILTANGQDPTGLTPGDLKQLQTILAANKQNVSEVPPGILKQFQEILTANEQNSTGLIPAALKQLQTIQAANKQNASEVPPGILKQFQEILTANGQDPTGLPPAATTKQTTTSLNKNEALVNQQLQAILSGESKDTLSIDTTHQSAQTEPLNTLTSPYLKSADNTSKAILTPVAHMAIQEVAATGVKETDAGKGVRQNVTEQFLHAKFEGLVDKNNTKNQQQDNGRQENSQNQQNTANTTLITPLNMNEQTGQFNLAALGVPASGTTTANAPLSHPVPLPSAIPVPAEELISHLVDRFSSNPRLQTSKISLNLNPAELGALKIDIMVKGDSIKAHIIAGSQQIQDTIEKNMPKLRSILEQQGFTIEDFQVSLESTNPDAHNFFQQQFSSRQDSGSQTKHAGSEDSFDLSLNSAEAILSDSKDSGVNLSI